MIQSTRLAKAAYWAAGELSRVKTYQRIYEWKNPQEFQEAVFGEALPELDMQPVGRIWLPCRLSMKLLGLSQDLDHKHWDHWALEHRLCEDGQNCNDCGGHIDPPYEMRCE